jgi:sugar lactone lactonase YvrE
MCPAPAGTIWVADSANHRVVRVDRGKGIVQQVATGALRAFTCALCGDDGSTLIICAASSHREHECRTLRDAVVLAAEV